MKEINTVIKHKEGRRLIPADYKKFSCTVREFDRWFEKHAPEHNRWEFSFHYDYDKETGYIVYRDKQDPKGEIKTLYTIESSNEIVAIEHRGPDCDPLELIYVYDSDKMFERYYPPRQKNKK